MMIFISLSWSGQIKFKDYAQKRGLDFKHDHGGSGKYYYVESMGSGVCIFDYDNDGDMDVYLVQSAPLPDWDKELILENKLFRNDGYKWKDVTDEAKVGNRDYGMGCACGDFDNDGAVDLYVTNFGQDILYRNNGDGTFIDITKNRGIDNPAMGMSAAFFDSDNDGWLDLYVTNYVNYSIDDNPECTSPMQYPIDGVLFARSYCDPDIFLGVEDKFYYNKKGTFIDRSNRSGIGRYKLRGMGVVTGDVDDDGDTDVYVANDKDMNLLFINNGKGRFTESAMITGTGYNGNGLAEAGMGVDLGDIDRDGHLDIYVTNYSGETNTLYHNRGQGLFIDETNERGLGKSSIHFLAFGTKFADLNLDGWLDIFVGNGHVIDNINLFNEQYEHSQHNQIYTNGSGIYRDKTLNIGGDMLDKAVSRGVASVDIDNDGDIDFIISNNNDSLSLLINEGKPSNNWIGFYLEGTISNRQAIGSKIKIMTRAGIQTAWVNPSGSYLSSNDQRVVFGLERDKIVDKVEIFWPGDLKEVFSDLKSNKYYRIIQGVSMKVIDDER
ncbi:MAG: CRTAC1 family protein [Candidatus Neomarinimicrobiota bacterium]